MLGCVVAQRASAQCDVAAMLVGSCDEIKEVVGPVQIDVLASIIGAREHVVGIEIAVRIGVACGQCRGRAIRIVSYVARLRSSARDHCDDIASMILEHIMTQFQCAVTSARPRITHVRIPQHNRVSK
jgi:hypothetical protein